jgi:hypothetical protein
MQLSNIKELLSGWLGVCADFLRTYRKYVLAMCGLIVVVVVFFSSVLPVIARMARESGSKVKVVEKTLADSFSTRLIEPGDMFLVDEPSFFPQIILSREPQAWSAEDVQSFWVDPLQQGSDRWQEEVKEALDTFMEKIP